MSSFSRSRASRWKPLARRRRPRAAPAAALRRGAARRADARPPRARALPRHPRHGPRDAGRHGDQERGARHPQGRHRRRDLRLPHQAGQSAADPLGGHPAARGRPDPPAAALPRLRHPVPRARGAPRRAAGLARVGRAGGGAGRVGGRLGQADEPGLQDALRTLQDSLRQDFARFLKRNYAGLAARRPHATGRRCRWTSARSSCGRCWTRTAR